MTSMIIFGGMVSLLINFAMGVFVYFKNRSNPVNKYFGLFSFCIAFWSGGSFLANIHPSPSLSLQILRFCYAAAVFLPSFYLHFILHLTHSQKIGVVRIAYLVSFILLFFLPTNSFIEGVRSLRDNFLISKPGPIYYIFFLFLNICTLSGLTHVFLTVKSSAGLQRLRLKWMLFAQLIAQLAGFEYFAAVFRVWNHMPLDDYILVGHFSIMTFAILRYRLMDIEVIVKRTLVFAGLTSFALAVFSSATFLTQELMSAYVGKGGRMVSLFASIFLIVLGYEPLRNFLINLTDKYLFQKKVNYRKLLKEATEYLAHLDSLKWQARRIVAFLIYKARIANASIYVFQSLAPGSLLLQASRPKIKAQGHRTILFSHPLVQYMKSHREPVELHSIEEAKAAEKNHEKVNEFDEIIRLFKDHRAEAAIPCFGSNAAERARRTELHLRGILFLGHQKSDEPYMEEDLDVFYTLGQESSIAFENARLYDEAVNKSRELEEINRKMNIAQTQLIHALDDTEKARKAEERAKEEALQAKKKTEEMELELIRREKLLFVEQLVKGLAHEIFNPMTSFRMETERLGNIFKEIRNYYRETNSHISAELKESVEIQLDLFRHSVNLLERTTDHVFRVVDNLYQMQKPDDQTIKPVDFKSYWAIAVPLIEAQSHGEVLEQVPIDSDGIQKNLFLVKGNGSQLTQVFLNLYRNALYAVKDKENKEIKIQADVDQKDNSFLKIIFEDNGTGIKPEVIPKIFDYLFTTKGEKGQGIGLNMCKNLIERFGGTITCKSKIGEGTKFIIRLPFVKEEMHRAIIQES